MDKCKIPSHNFVLFDNVLLHVLILFTILTCGFIFYISKITYTEFNDKFVKIIDENINPDVIKSTLNEKYPNMPNLSNFFSAVSKNYLNTQDQLRNSVNKKITQELIIIIVFLLIVVIIVNYLSRKANYCGILKHLALELVIIFSCVGGIEYWFFNNVAMNFVPVYPSTLVTAFKNKINKTFS